jgi:PAS domain S-box-containing protein
VFAGDEQKNRAAELLNITLLTMLLGAVLYGVFAPIVPAAIPQRIFIVGSTCAVLVVALVATRRGYVYPASAILIITLWLVSTYTSLISGGVRSPAFGAYLVIILVAGLTLGMAASLITTIASLIAGVVILTLESNGAVANITVLPTTTALVWGYSTYMVVGSLVLGLALRRIDRELAERKEASLALQEAEARYRELVERIPAVVYSSEPGATGRWRYVSPQIERLSGFTPNEWLADPNLWYKQIHPDDRESAVASEAAALAAHQPPQSEYRLRHKDRHEVWVRDESMRVAGSANSPSLVQGFLLDITDRKQAELVGQRQLQELTTLQAVADHIATATTENDLIERVTTLIGKVLYPTDFGILLMNESLGLLQVHPSYHSISPVQVETVPKGQGIVSWVAAEGLPRRIGDIQTNSHYRLHAPITRSELCVPIKVGERVLGVINTESDRVDGFSEADERLLMTIAGQLATALERLRAEDAQRQYAARMEILHEIDRALLGSQSPQTIAQTATQNVRRLLNCQRASIATFDLQAREVNFLAVSSISGSYLPINSVVTLEAFGTHIVDVLQEGRPNIIGDVLTAQPVAETDRQHAQEGIRSWLNVPLTYQGALIGSLNLGGTTPNMFTSAQIDIAREVADQLAITLQQAWLNDEMAEALKREQRLNTISQIISSVLDLPALLGNVVRLAAELVGADAGSLSLIAPGLDALTDVYSFKVPESLNGQTLSKGQGLTWQVYEEGHSVLLDHYPSHPRALPEWVDAGLQSYLGVLVATGETRLGTLGLYRHESARPFTLRDMALAESVGQQAGVAIQNAQLYAARQQELSERQRAEQALLESEKTLRALLNATVDEEFLIDTEGNFLALNEPLAASMGLKIEDLQDRNAFETLTPELAAARWLQINQVIQSGQPIQFEDESPSGWYENRLTPVFDEQGQVVKLAIFVRDITERKQADAALRRRDAILEAVAFAAQQFLKSAQWQSSIQAVLEQLGRGTDASHVYIFENHTTAAGLAVTSQRFEWVAPGAQPDIDNPTFQNVPIWEPTFWRWAQNLNAGKPFFANLSSLLPEESNYLLPRGVKSILDVPIYVEGVWWGIIGLDDYLVEREWSAAEVDALKVAAGILSAAIQRQHADAQIRQLNADLERRVVERTAALETANQELEAFSYSVSHDLRAPLRSIDGFSQALLEDYGEKVDADGQRYLKIVRRETQRMGYLIDDLLSLSRVARRDIKQTQVNLSKLAAELIEELRQRDPERQVETTIAPNMTVRGDNNLLRIMLDNLLQNSWKFTGRRAVAHVELGTELQADQLVYFVKDDGAGFDMNYASKLFGVFQRLHTTSEFEGTGVGLATVRRIVQRHGGRVWAKAVMDEGATFYFTLPQ